MPKVRLDALLTELGLFESRSRAAASVLAGEVRVGAARRRVDKPGQLVARDEAVEVRATHPYVSRGAIKLANALDALGIDVVGRRGLDVGASTGGFSDCLLQRGAAHVVALDVAYGQLHWRLRSDERITAIERCNARHLEPAGLPYAPELIVIDVSFISLTKLLAAVLACAAPRFDCLAMVKPQFELGPGRVGSGGVVRDAGDRREALLAIAHHARQLGVAVCGFASSGLPGPKGNRETFVWLAEPMRPGLADVEQAVREVEP